MVDGRTRLACLCRSINHRLSTINQNTAVWPPHSFSFRRRFALSCMPASQIPAGERGQERQAMQISSYETQRVLDHARELKKKREQEKPVGTVAELAKKYGVNLDEVKKHAERVMMQEEDPARERRVRELAARVADGSYDVTSEEIIDMAKRRAIADNSR